MKGGEMGELESLDGGCRGWRCTFWCQLGTLDGGRWLWFEEGGWEGKGVEWEKSSSNGILVGQERHEDGSSHCRRKFSSAACSEESEKKGTYRKMGIFVLNGWLFLVEEIAPN